MIPPMIPGEYFTADGDIELNADRVAITLLVANTGDRPVQVGVTLPLCRNQPRPQL